ncbi:ectoine hydroxylase [Salipaludibacillus keqinensis]|uniref:Ectoine hydroxylase n=1 Tax=Salipaludibacillus keqinensis TaxID=2045207 RepID=A0A323T8C6_9BACI|nr:ectoine hydroxylase [Salipaludibacillus keqinensis]PYZ91951.1 ectoine hydroxylase [Salipaludibacillus keqinensis]
MQMDRYPSRLGDGEAQISQRKDPVVYGNTEEGPLKKEELDFYEENGYLLFDSLFTDEEVKAMQESLNETMRKEELRESNHVIKEPGSNEIRSVFEIHKEDSFFQSLSKYKRIVEIAEQLLKSQVYVMQSRINFKPGFKGKEFYWHSDFETWHVEDGMPNMRAVSCSIVLTDNYEFNGPLMLIPGSQKWYVSCPGKTQKDNFKTSLKKQESGVPDNESMTELVEEADGEIDRATGPAGSVLFFDCNTMHGSAGNISPYSRSNIFFVFNSVENQLVQPFGGQNPRPEFLANRKEIEAIEPIGNPFRKLQNS